MTKRKAKKKARNSMPLKKEKSAQKYNCLLHVVGMPKKISELQEEEDFETGESEEEEEEMETW